VDEQEASQARVGLVLLAGLTLAGLAAALALGAMVVDLGSGVGCFDGDEPACTMPDVDRGLSEIRTSSWVLAGVAAFSGATALVVALRRRPSRRRAVVVGLLCATTWLLAAALWTRV
jgi:hypothetical protein